MLRKILGWSGIVQVDNVNLTFNFMGIGDIHLAPATLRSAQITPTQTILTYAAGPIRLIVDYLSPIEVCGLSMRLHLLTDSRRSSSPMIGSKCPSRLRTCPSLRNLPMGALTKFVFTLISVEVREKFQVHHTA